MKQKQLFKNIKIYKENKKKATNKKEKEIQYEDVNAKLLPLNKINLQKGIRNIILKKRKKAQ